VAADAVEAMSGRLFAHAREHVVHEPLHRVGVRRMAEAADEHEVAALRERLPVPAMRCRFDRTSTRAAGASVASSLRSASLTTRVASLRAMTSSSSARVRSAARCSTRSFASSAPRRSRR
jgi:hypothetical protein